MRFGIVVAFIIDYLESCDSDTKFMLRSSSILDDLKRRTHRHNQLDGFFRQWMEYNKIEFLNEPFFCHSKRLNMQINSI